jgi:hypothetical protein
MNNLRLFNTTRMDSATLLTNLDADIVVALTNTVYNYANTGKIRIMNNSLRTKEGFDANNVSALNSIDGDTLLIGFEDGTLQIKKVIYNKVGSITPTDPKPYPVDDIKLLKQSQGDGKIVAITALKNFVITATDKKTLQIWCLSGPCLKF